MAFLSIKINSEPTQVSYTDPLNQQNNCEFELRGKQKILFDYLVKNVGKKISSKIIKDHLAELLGLETLMTEKVKAKFVQEKITTQKRFTQKDLDAAVKKAMGAATIQILSDAKRSLIDKFFSCYGRFDSSLSFPSEGPTLMELCAGADSSLELKIDLFSPEVYIDYWVSKKEELLPLATEARKNDALLLYPKGFVNAIVIYGDGSQTLNEDQVSIDYMNEPFVIPLSQQAKYDAFVQQTKENAQANGKDYWNGPCVRLINYRTGVQGGARIALEERTLHLNLGPMCWDDYIGMNRRLVEAEGLKHKPLTKLVQYGLEGIPFRPCVLATSKLANILDTATTIVSNDGYVLYHLRSKKTTASPDVFTSAAAENMNRYKDHVSSSSSWDLVHANPTKKEVEAHVDYDPLATNSNHIVHPFAAARRGIAEEISKGLKVIGLHMTGLTFDLDSMHPNALFLAAIDMKAEEIVDAHKGRNANAIEGEDKAEIFDMRYVRPDFTNPETEKALEGQWTAGGKASMVRAIKVIRLLETEETIARCERIFETLADSN